MKTQLPLAITTVEEAIAFLTESHKNGESYHPEDDATDIAWICQPPTLLQSQHLNCLMANIYDLPGNDGRHTDLAFDPCEYLNLLSNADTVISLDGERTTIGKYMSANDWDAIQDHISAIAYLEEDEDYLITTAEEGFIIAKRLTFA